MPPTDEIDEKLQRMIRDFALRLIVPRWTEFDDVLEGSMRVCDRYRLGQTQMDHRLGGAWHLNQQVCAQAPHPQR